MPAFRLNRAFGIGKNKKVFVNLQCGLSRGAPPDFGDREELAENLRDARRENRSQRKEIRKIRKNQRKGIGKTRKIRQQRLEIFQLRNELGAARELVESNRDAMSTRGAGEPETGRLPDFVIIGAQRCGTSQFYGVLTRHPNIDRAALKEVHYFDRPGNFDRGIEWYRLCFPPPQWTDGHKSITGEASPRYLVAPSVPERAARILPEAKLIVLLRNPVDRAYSQYHKMVRQGEALSFEEVVEADIAWLEQHQYDTGASPKPPNSAVVTGLYVDHLQRWRKFFSDGQMLVLNSGDFFERTTETIDLAHDFLGLPRREFNRKSRGSRRGVKYNYEPMAPATRERLEAFFEPYNKRLYEYLGRDFGWS